MPSMKHSEHGTEIEVDDSSVELMSMAGFEHAGSTSSTGEEGNDVSGDSDSGADSAGKGTDTGGIRASSDPARDGRTKDQSKGK